MLLGSVSSGKLPSNTIVCGLGKVSKRVTRWILDLNEEVIVIESNPENSLIPEVRRWGVPVVIADARRPEVLLEVGITEAESIVPCTRDDLMNLSIALEARRLVPDIKVVLRMFDVQMAENVRTGFNIHTAFSIPELSAPAFAAAATKAPLDYAFSFGEGEERYVFLSDADQRSMFLGQETQPVDLGLFWVRYQQDPAYCIACELMLCFDERWIAVRGEEPVELGIDTGKAIRLLEASKGVIPSSRDKVFFHPLG